MSTGVDHIATLEWANYAAQLPAVRATPGLNLTMGDESIVLTSVLPSPDVNHACLLRATPDSIDDLISETIRRFRGSIMPPRVFVSPACSPQDLEARLLARGFVKQEEEEETWMTLKDLGSYEIPAPARDVVVAEVTRRDALTFSRIFAAAFDMPWYYVPFMAFLLWPSMGSPGYHHYLARTDGRPVGVCSMIHYESFGILGSVGVVPKRQGGRIAASLLITSGQEARRAGVETVMLQTASSSSIVRRMQFAGFTVAFTRSCYVLR
jgi:hypothetical protein